MSISYPRKQVEIASNRKRARKLRRRWFGDLERVIDREEDVHWEDSQLSEYWCRTFTFSRGDKHYWGTFIIQFVPVPPELAIEAQPDQLGMIGICQCNEIVTEEGTDD